MSKNNVILKGNSLMGRNRAIINLNGTNYGACLYGVEKGIVYIRTKGALKTQEFLYENVSFFEEEELANLSHGQAFIVPANPEGEILKILRKADDDTPNTYWEPEKDLFKGC